MAPRRVSPACLIALLVDRRVLGIIADTRASNLTLTRQSILDFAVRAKEQLLKSTDLSEQDRKRLEVFQAGDSWCRHFLERHDLRGKTPHGSR